MTLFLDDGDVRLYHGDALEVLREMPDESVDCVVTSPPYWGLRDYGTGEWDGGDPDCDHKKYSANPSGASSTLEGGKHILDVQTEGIYAYRDVCGKCGARRVDRQMGLEPTPDLFVAGMVELFREIRRVLAPHGTCWVNLGDSYAQNSGRTDRKERDERHSGRVSGTETGTKTRPRDTSTSPRGEGLSDGGLRGDGGSEDGSGHGGTGNLGRKQEFAERGHERGYDAGSNWANYGDRIGEARSTVVDGLKPKDLCGIPWRVAFALQADGWWLRSDIIWAKPNPMPESVTDRPTKAHEYVFLLTKQPRYWFDTEAVREPSIYPDDDRKARSNGSQKRHPTDMVAGIREGSATYPSRNVRSVWQIATQPYPEAHFATFPEELARRCILAGCPTRVCRVCGKPSERIVERESSWEARREAGAIRGNVAFDGKKGAGTQRRVHGDGVTHDLGGGAVTTVGWSDCGHNNWRPGTVLDPFIGSGTVAKVARDHQRHAIGIDLNAQYLELAARRLQQLSLLT